MSEGRLPSEDRLTLPVNEVFRSIQGEGPNAGRNSLFVRLNGCPVRCSWCDTKYTWKSGEITPAVHLTANQILAHRESSSNLVITGGEPLLYAGRLPFRELVDRFPGFVEIETSGWMGSPEDVDALLERKPDSLRFNVSPKLPSSETGMDYRQVWEKWQEFPASRVAFKWVVGTLEDLLLVQWIVRRSDPTQHWLMPLTLPLNQQTHSSHVLSAVQLAQAAVDLGCHYSHRIHVALWGPAKGR